MVKAHHSVTSMRPDGVTTSPSGLAKRSKSCSSSKESGDPNDGTAVDQFRIAARTARAIRNRPDPVDAKAAARLPQMIDSDSETQASSLAGSDSPVRLWDSQRFITDVRDACLMELSEFRVHDRAGEWPDTNETWVFVGSHTFDDIRAHRNLNDLQHLRVTLPAGLWSRELKLLCAQRPWLCSIRLLAPRKWRRHDRMKWAMHVNSVMRAQGVLPAKWPFVSV